MLGWKFGTIANNSSIVNVVHIYGAGMLVPNLAYYVI